MDDPFCGFNSEFGTVVPSSGTVSRVGSGDASAQLGRFGGPSEGVRSVERALRLLDHFDAEHPTHTLADLATATGLPKTTAARLLATLENAGILTGSDGGVMTVGPTLVRWAALARSLWQEPIQPMLDALAGQLGDTVQVQRRHLDSRVLVAQGVGPQELRFEGRIGDKYELWRGAASHLLLKGADVGFLEQIAAESDGQVDVQELKARIAGADERGWEATEGQRERGVAGVAVPIRDSWNQPAAALVLVGPSPRVMFQAAEVAAELREHAEPFAKALQAVGALP